MLTKPNPASTTLYSHSQELESHAVRFIMAHKSIDKQLPIRIIIIGFITSYVYIKSHVLILIIYIV